MDYPVSVPIAQDVDKTDVPNSDNGALHEETPSEKRGLPRIVLPGPCATISFVATKLGRLLEQERTHFRRGGTVVRLGRDNAEHIVLEPVKAATLASDFERVAQIQRSKETRDGHKTVKDVCRKGDAELILASQAFLEELPQLRVLSRCPVLVERGEKLVEITGYDPESGILAEGDSPEQTSLEDAKRMLNDLLTGFKFASPGDKSRALAAIITPALVLGGLLPGRAPIDLGEADQSQTGKGFRNKLTAATYRHTPTAVCQQRSGVDSLEEAFDRSLIAGHTFISLDNIRGRVDSQKVESFVTEDTYYARCAYMPNTAIDPSRVYLMFTSNRAEMTQDLANRSSCVRILKQADDYQFSSYPEGSILDHVRANQPRFLGAVFAIVREWFQRGKPQTEETRHDFRGWAQVLDWIVQNLLDASPLMDGHRETQQRMTNPALNWLRDVALAVVRQQKTGDLLLANDLLEVIDVDGTIEIPGLKDGDDATDDEVRKKCLQQIGRRLSKCFGDTDRIEIDGMSIERKSFTDDQHRERFQYQILEDPANAPLDAPGPGRVPPVADASEPPGEREENPKPTDAPTDNPLMTPLIKPRDPADPTIDSVRDVRAGARAHEAVMEPIAGSGGNSGVNNGAPAPRREVVLE